MPKYKTIAIVGVGLMGGSIGLAMKSLKLAADVVGIGRNEESLQQAARVGSIDRFTTDLTDGVADAEVIFVCTPVSMVVEHIRAAAKACPKDAILTDVGSTKAEIVGQLSGGPLPNGTFIGSHPLAGDHRTGVAHARANLFARRRVIITPSDNTPKGISDRLQTLWELLGAMVNTMTPGEHDNVVAVISHAPHLAATAIALATQKEALPFAATGWQDTTRVAAGDPALWRDIIGTNRKAVSAAIARVEEQLASLRKSIDTGDLETLEQQLSLAKRIRDAVGN